MALCLAAAILLGFNHPESAHPFSSTPELEAMFDRATGPGVWKWRHYLSIYEKHLVRFRHSTVRVLEVGIFSGGSLKLWREYFGSDAYIAGLDISPLTRVYEHNPDYGRPDKIFVGSQSDETLWARIANETALDVIIDDGAHTPEHQIATLDLAFKHLRPGGVYICEDLILKAYGPSFVNHVAQNYVVGPAGMSYAECDKTRLPANRKAGIDQFCSLPSYTQSHIAEVAFYHLVVVITKMPTGYMNYRTHGERFDAHGARSGEDSTPWLASWRRGTQWAPPKFWTSGGSEQHMGR